MSSSDLQNPLYVHVYDANAIMFVEPAIPADVGIRIGVGVGVGVVAILIAITVIVLCLVCCCTTKG